jgi:hypothetical protein
MKRLLVTIAVFGAALSIAGLAEAQTYYPSYPPFPLAPAMPSSMPTVSPYSARLPDSLTGTSKPTITATPDCGAANPQGGIPSMTTGNCP